MRSQLALAWGVETFIVPPVLHTDDVVRRVEAALLDIGRCGKGDKVVIVSGSPLASRVRRTYSRCTASATRSRHDHPMCAADAAHSEQ
jgi:pyruvate kinase